MVKEATELLGITAAPVKETKIRFDRAARWGAIGAGVGVLGTGALAIAGLSYGGGLGGFIVAGTNYANMWSWTEPARWAAGIITGSGFIGAMAGAMTADGEIKRAYAANEHDARLAIASRNREQTQNHLALMQTIGKANAQGNTMGLAPLGYTPNLPVSVGKQQVGPGGTLGA